MLIKWIIQMELLTNHLMAMRPMIKMEVAIDAWANSKSSIENEENRSSIYSEYMNCMYWTDDWRYHLYVQ